jgi:type II secretory pathway component PulF
METSGDKQRHSVAALILLVLDLFLAVCMFMELGFVVPVFGEMFRDFGHRLSLHTKVVLNISNIIMAFHGLGFGILLCLALWTIVQRYLTLNRRRERKMLFFQLWLIFFSFVLLMVIITLAMFISPMGMGPAINK